MSRSWIENSVSSSSIDGSAWYSGLRFERFGLVRAGIVSGSYQVGRASVCKHRLWYVRVHAVIARAR